MGHKGKQVKMTVINAHLSITQNINGLNSPIKRHRLVEYIKKENSSFCCLQDIHVNFKDKYFLRVKGYMPKNGSKKQAGVPIMISDKIHFK